METSSYLFIVFVPVSHADAIRKALVDAGAGSYAQYDSCSFSTTGVGRFRPLEGASPAIGQVGKHEQVEEVRIETVVSKDSLQSVHAAVKDAHPYQKPTIYTLPVQVL